MQNRFSPIVFVVFIVLSLFGSNLVLTFADAVYVPYVYKWSIYELDPELSTVSLIYSSLDKISNVRLSPDGSVLAFSKKFGGDGYEHEEIYTINVNGGDLRRLTENMEWDIYPVWSPDGSKIAFLTMNETLDIYTMNADGSNRSLLYDSGHHDSDLHWRGDKIAFTQEHQIWVMNKGGTEEINITDPPRAGEWGNSVLPFGDYDPRISPDGSSVVFERMVDDTSPHGIYDIFMVDLNGDNLRNITDTGWTQGMAVWSSNGDSLVYTVSAKGETGVFDIYTINPDGTDMKDLTSELLPPTFLCHTPIYSADNKKVTFIGEWWDWKQLNTTITCNVIQTAANLKATQIEGTISPIVADAEVKIKIIKPDKSTEIITDTTSIDGEYQTDYTVSEKGEYIFSVSWNGDPGHNPSTSSDSTLTIQEPESGIPGYPIEAIIIGIIVYILVKCRS